MKGSIFYLCLGVSQETYCGGYSIVDPPLTIPNREVKRNHADGTYTPVGRVGSRRSLTKRAPGSLDLEALVEERRLPTLPPGRAVPSA